jgi:hypothetical protein
MALHRVKQPNWAADPRFSFAPVRHQFVEMCGDENAFGLGVPLNQAQPPAARPVPQLVAENDVSTGGGGVDDHHVGQAVEMVPQ